MDTEVMMKLQLADRVTQFDEYIFASLTKVVAEVEKNTGRKVLNLGVGSPDVPPSQTYLNALLAAVQKPNAHLYPGYQAIPEFAEALIAWYLKRFNVALTKEEIFPIQGAKDGVTHMPLVLLNEGDEILVPDPGYPAYFTPTLFVKAKAVSYNIGPENNFGISISELERKVTPKTKGLWVNFPSNPTGRVASFEELKGLVSFCQKHNLVLMYDNAYSEITFDGIVAPSILEVPGAKEVAIEIQSFSKTFSLAGYRMGWMVGNKDIIAAFAKVKSQIDSGMSLPLQQLGAFVLTHQDLDWHARMMKSYQERRNILAAKLTQLGLTFELPPATLYIWAKIPNNAQNSTEFSLQLLREKQILVTPGIAFGQNGDRYVRVTISADISQIDDYV